MNKKSILSLILALATVTAQAQLTDWQNISSKNFVMKIIHDQNFLYVGTKGGGIVKIDKQSGEQTVLKRADGSMTGNSITDMALHNGELWVGTEYNGLAKVTDGGIEKYDMTNAGFQNNQYFSGFYFNADGTMLVGGIAYLYAFDGKKCTTMYDINPLSPYAYVKKIRADRDGRIWVACYDALNRYNLCVFTPNELVPYNIPYGKANNIETDKDGCLWIATNFDGNSWTTYNHNNSPLPSDCFWDVQVDADNRLWIATVGDVGLVCFDGTTWTTYDTDNSGIALNEVTKITLDPHRDLIWLTQYPGLGLSVARMNCHNTDVHSIAAPNISTVIYDLQGRLAKPTTHGIYINNGKKIIK